nr:reverse transcriptase domain-containing protein [Tanacetum cinerariifolium]
MPPRMRTQSVGRPAVESLGGGTVYGLVEVDEVEDLGKGVNGNVEGANRGAPDFSTIIAQQLQEPLTRHASSGCSYKEFLACNPKEYDGKGGAVVLTRWIKKMKNVQDMNGCSIDQKVKPTAGSFMGKALMWWNSQIRMVTDIIKMTKSKQNQTKPSTKWKAWKSQKSTKVNQKSTQSKSKLKTEPRLKNC